MILKAAPMTLSPYAGSCVLAVVYSHRVPEERVHGAAGALPAAP